MYSARYGGFYNPHPYYDPLRRPKDEDEKKEDKKKSMSFADILTIIAFPIALWNIYDLVANKRFDSFHGILLVISIIVIANAYQKFSKK